ncbi:molecular chaperone [Sphingomonas sp. Root241]|uniref:fimbrial biogenesis chaperone n=1 Tax=Sphingomonas sp. Root241 TaxID=1736501 RepID=UPI0006F2E547|nr:fimbria/pilus periplasmic chaperone [Sphingomonas sp. Root241]KRC81573.1 pilus assembly protein PapD [Sphingomonas sp. Root241]
MRAGAAIVAILLLPLVAQASSLKVYPVRIVLTPKEPVQTMTIQNGSSEAARIQLRVFSWRQVDGEDKLEETRDILANPGSFEIAGQGEQIARFGLRTSPGTVEKSYRVILEEVPGSRPSEPGKVRTLLRISIPIFVPAPNPVGRLSWRAWAAGDRKMTFEIRNQGTVHVQINRLALAGPKGTKLGTGDMSVYLLPGASRRVVLDIDAPVRAGDPLKLSAVTDQGDLAADLVAEAAPHETGRP